MRDLLKRLAWMHLEESLGRGKDCLELIIWKMEDRPSPDTITTDAETVLLEMYDDLVKRDYFGTDAERFNVLSVLWLTTLTFDFGSDIIPALRKAYNSLIASYQSINGSLPIRENHELARRFRLSERMSRYKDTNSAEIADMEEMLNSPAYGIIIHNIEQICADFLMLLHFKKRRIYDGAINVLTMDEFSSPESPIPNFFAEREGDTLVYRTNLFDGNFKKRITPKGKVDILKRISIPFIMQDILEGDFRLSGQERAYNQLGLIYLTRIWRELDAEAVNVAYKMACIALTYDLPLEALQILATTYDKLINHKDRKWTPLRVRACDKDVSASSLLLSRVHQFYALELGEYASLTMERVESTKKVLVEEKLERKMTLALTRDLTGNIH